MNRKIVKNLGTCFGLGNLKKAPGTFGTLGGIPVFLILSATRVIFIKENIYNSFYFLFLVGFFAFAVYISNICEKEIYKAKDPQNVVIDEVFGYVTTLFLITPRGFAQYVFAIVLAFIIFRFFDITKIGPINKVQKYQSGVGVVLDDFVAGVIGNFLMVIIWTIFF